MWDVLADRLVTVALGSHDSLAVHREVIDLLVACGGGEHDHTRSCFRRLAALAGEAAEALAAGDLDAWAAVSTAATDTQADLHAGLVGAAHRRAITIARAHDALGWKVNGAGGEGGSLTVLAARRRRRGRAAQRGRGRRCRVPTVPTSVRRTRASTVPS